MNARAGWTILRHPRADPPFAVVPWSIDGRGTFVVHYEAVRRCATLRRARSAVPEGSRLAHLRQPRDPHYYLETWT